MIGETLTKQPKPRSTKMPKNTKLKPGKITLDTLVSDINFIIPPNIFQTMLRHVRSANLEFWGMKKPRCFVRVMLLATIHHDSTLMGYQRFLRRFQLPFHISDKSLAHNIRLVRATLASWAKENIEIGDWRDWNAAAREIEVPEDLKGTNLWMDSTDVPIQKAHGMTAKSPEWSHKLGRVGRRYLVLADGDLYVRQVFGGYSPKLYDGHATVFLKTWIEEHLNNGVIIADQHFEWAAKRLDSIQFYTPIKSPPNPSHQTSLLNARVLTKKQIDYNSSHSHLRARIEMLFGWVKNTFLCFSQPFPEELEQLDLIFIYVIGIHNCLVRSRSNPLYF